MATDNKAAPSFHPAITAAEAKLRALEEELALIDSYGGPPLPSRNDLVNHISGARDIVSILKLAFPQPMTKVEKVDDRAFYDGDPWHAEEDDQTVRVFRDQYQVFKAPKNGTPYAEYWPSPEMICWMLSVLNAAETTGNTPGVPC